MTESRGGEEAGDAGWSPGTTSPIEGLSPVRRCLALTGRLRRPFRLLGPFVPPGPLPSSGGADVLEREGAWSPGGVAVGGSCSST